MADRSWAALALVEAGFEVFPCEPGSKAPLGELVPSGRNDASLDPDTVCDWWGACEDANPGIACGDILVIDDDGGLGAWLDGAPERLAELTDAPMVKTRSGGRHFYFRQPERDRWGSTQGSNQGRRLAVGIDTRGRGGYVVGPGSWVAKDSKGPAGGYSWLGGDVEDVEDLPYPPAWLAEALDHLEKGAPAPGGAASDLVIEGSTEAVTSGNRHRSLMRLAGQLRQYGLSSSAVLAGLVDFNERRCDPPKGRNELQRIAEYVMRFEPEAILEAYLGCIDVDVFPSSSTESSDDDAGEAAEPHPGDFPEHLYDVPGFIGEATEWLRSQLWLEQRELPFLAAIAAQATMAARKLTDIRGNWTNLYLIGVAGSGTGKSSTLQRLEKVWTAAGIELADIYGSNDWASDSGLLNEVEDNPAALYAIDEFGHVLKDIGEARSQATAKIAKTLNDLYSAAGGEIRGKAYADKRKTSIKNPVVNLLAMTQQHWWHKSLTEAMLVDGFAARLIVLPGPRGARRSATLTPVPGELSGHAAAWIYDVPEEISVKGNLAKLEGKSRAVVVPWADGVEDELAALQQLADQEMAESVPYAETMWARVAEKACRLALVYAASTSDRAKACKVTAAGMRWAAELATWATRWAIHDISEHLTCGAFSERRKEVLSILNASPDKRLKKRDLTRRLRKWEKRDRDSTINSMLDVCDIYAYAERSGLAGRPCVWFSSVHLGVDGNGRNGPKLPNTFVRISSSGEDLR